LGRRDIYIFKNLTTKPLWRQRSRQQDIIKVYHGKYVVKCELETLLTFVSGNGLGEDDIESSHFTNAVISALYYVHQAILSKGAPTLY
jgi:hypothetical protein